MSVELVRDREALDEQRPGPADAESSAPAESGAAEPRASARLLRKYTERVDGPETPGESEDVEDCGCFGWLRGIRDRALMLELRKRDGNIVAIGYAWIERLEFDPSEGITLHCGGRMIRIQGRDLNAETRPTIRLIDGLARHRVPWIRESAARGLGSLPTLTVEAIRT